MQTARKPATANHLAYVLIEFATDILAFVTKAVLSNTTLTVAFLLLWYIQVLTFQGYSPLKTAFASNCC